MSGQHAIAVAPQVSVHLRELRVSAFCSGSGFARALGWSQSRVSKIETGAKLPSRDEIEAWVTATSGDPALVDGLWEQREAARVERALSRAYGGEPGPGGPAERAGDGSVGGDGLGRTSRYRARAEQDARAIEVWEYQPAMLPVLLQTRDYTCEILGAGTVSLADRQSDDLEELLAARRAYQEDLYRGDCELTLVLGEAALYAAPGSPATMTAQLQRLEVLLDLPTMSLGVVPFDTPMPAPPMTGFVVHDRARATIESVTRDQHIDDPDEVAVYRSLFEQLSTHAATGPDAKDLIRRARTAFAHSDPAPQKTALPNAGPRAGVA